MNEREVSLVISAKEGDSKAFEDLYTHYYDKIFALARMTMRNEADCEDILQETFISAWKNLHKLSNPAGFNTWLQKITLNLCYSLLRKKNITILLDSENELENFSEESSDELLPAIYAERNDLRVRLGKIIDSLSDVQKQTIVLYYFNEHKVEEIADIMECSVSTVKTRLFLARKTIRSEVEAQEQKSGEKFYGVAGIPLLSFGELFKQHIESQLLLAEVSASIPVAVAEVLSQGGHGGAQAVSVAAETAKGSALSALPLSTKIAAVVGILVLCTGAVVLGVHFLGNSDVNGGVDLQTPLVETAPDPIIETAPIPTDEDVPELSLLPDFAEIITLAVAGPLARTWSMLLDFDEDIIWGGAEMYFDEDGTGAVYIRVIPVGVPDVERRVFYFNWSLNENMLLLHNDGGTDWELERELPSDFASSGNRFEDRDILFGDDFAQRIFDISGVAVPATITPTPELLSGDWLNRIVVIDDELSFGVSLSFSRNHNTGGNGDISIIENRDYGGFVTSAGIGYLQFSWAIQDNTLTLNVSPPFASRIEWQFPDTIVSASWEDIFNDEFIYYFLELLDLI